MPDVLEAIVSGHVAGQYCQNVFHFNCTNTAGANPFSYAKNLTESLESAGGFLSNYIDCLPEDYVGSSVRSRLIKPTPGPTHYSGAGAWVDGFTGGRTGKLSSAQVSPLIVWIGTSLPNKTGRCFLPGISEDDIEEMVLGNGLPAVLATFMAKFIAGASTSTIDWEGAIYRRGFGTADSVQNAYVSPHIGTQRRRLTPV